MRQMFLGHPSTWRQQLLSDPVQRFPPEPGEHPIPARSIVQTETAPHELAGDIFKRDAESRAFSAMQRRTAAVVQPRLIVSPRDDRPRSRDMADFVRIMLREMGDDLDMLRWNMHWGGFYAGSATAEKWPRRLERGPFAGFILPAIIDQEWHHITWRYTPPGTALDAGDYTALPALYARRPDGKHVPISARRGIHFAPRTRIEPYGKYGVLELVHWAIELARLAHVDWSYLVQSEGEPKYKITTEPNNEARVQELAGEVAGLKERGYAILFDDEDLERLATSVAAGSADIGAFTRSLEMIAIGAILSGGFDSAGMGLSGGSFARAKAGDSAARPLLLTDMALLERTLEKQLVWWIVADNYGAEVANQHAPYLTTDAWELDEWERHQEGLFQLLDHGLPVRPETAYKMAIREEPPAPDDEVVTGKAPREAPAPPRPPEDRPEPEDASPEEVAEEVDRADAILRGRRRNEWRPV
jgi:hypothetical protein